MAAKKAGRVRWVALGTVLGVVAVWGGFGIVGAATSAPTALTTCTKASNGKTKVIATSGVAKCTAKGKGFAQSWTDARYKAFADYEGCEGGLVSPPCGSNNFSGLALQHTIHFFLVNANLSGANLSGSYFAGNTSGLNFTGANLTNTSWVGSDAYQQTQPVDLTDVNLTNANLTGSGFVNVPVTGSGIIFNNTTCPDGTKSQAHGFTCVGFGM